MPDTNKQVIRRWLDTMNKGKGALLNSIADWATASYVCHDATLGDIKGHDGLRNMITGFFDAFPDLHCEIADMVEEGDRVVTRVKFRGTHRGGFLGAPPSGKSVHTEFICISRFENGKVAEEWEIVDVHGLLQQLAPEKLQNLAMV